MKCRSPISFKPRNKKVPITVSCGQCLPCRIRKRSQWLSRIQLESLSSVSRSFWTLTYEDCESLTLPQIKEHTRTLFNSLRKSELRAGNRNMIRYFGCLELGGSFGRPHMHFLIFNLAANLYRPSPYLRGLPRPTVTLPLWPHGLVDIAQFNNATATYVCKYLTEFTKEDDFKPVPFRTIRPGIGFYGLQQLAAQTVKTHSILPHAPDYLTISGSPRPIDEWTKNQFVDQFRKLGGVVVSHPLSTEQKLEKRQVMLEVEDQLPETYWTRQDAKLRWLETQRRLADGKRQATEIQASARYQARQATSLRKAG